MNEIKEKDFKINKKTIIFSICVLILLVLIIFIVVINKNNKELANDLNIGKEITSEEKDFTNDTNTNNDQETEETDELIEENEEENEEENLYEASTASIALISSTEETSFEDVYEEQEKTYQINYTAVNFIDNSENNYWTTGELTQNSTKLNSGDSLALDFSLENNTGTNIDIKQIITLSSDFVMTSSEEEMSIIFDDGTIVTPTYNDEHTIATYEFLTTSLKKDESENYDLNFKIKDITRNAIVYEIIDINLKTYVSETDTSNTWLIVNNKTINYETTATPVYLAQDSDFDIMPTPFGDVFLYIGTETEVEIPEIIQGVTITNYMAMFMGTEVTKVVSSNTNIDSIEYMFLELQSSTLDLSEFDLSSVTKTDFCFADALTTTGITRNQTEADLLNSSLGKPESLNFSVKSNIIGNIRIIDNSANRVWENGYLKNKNDKLVGGEIVALDYKLLNNTNKSVDIKEELILNFSLPVEESEEELSIILDDNTILEPIYDIDHRGALYILPISSLEASDFLFRNLDFKLKDSSTNKLIEAIIDINLNITIREKNTNNEWENPSNFSTIYDPSWTYLAQDSDFDGDSNGDFDYIGTEQKLRIPEKIKGIELTSYSGMFYNTHVTKVVSFNPNVTDMSSTFSRTQEANLDLLTFDTSNVTNMSMMFDNSRVKNLDLSSFDTTNVTNMRSMFQNSQADTLDLSTFNTSNVTDMGGMFYGMDYLYNLNLSSFDTSNVEDMDFMFYGSNVINLDLSSFNTTNVTIMNGMFRSSEIINLNLSSFDTSNVTNMDQMFHVCSTENLDLLSFNTSSVTKMEEMFLGYTGDTLDLSSFDISNVTKTDDMFRYSDTTTGYARTQADADRLNASSNKPSGLTFTVK